MEISFNKPKLNGNILVSDCINVESDYLVIPFTKELNFLDNRIENLDKELNGVISSKIEDKVFKGDRLEVDTITTLGKVAPKNIILIGLGESDKIDNELFRNIGGAIFNSVKKGGLIAYLPIGEFGVAKDEMVKSIMEGQLLASYNFSLKSEKSETKEVVFEFVIDDEKLKSSFVLAMVEASNGVSGSYLTRDLVNYPPNVANPKLLARSAREIKEETGLDVEILGQKEIEALNMGSFLSVARGSIEEPQFIIMEHNREKRDQLKTIVLVGKGITFDTGGYNLKSAAGIYGMKHDMAGGAAVIGAMKSISKLNLPVHVVGLVPACENKISNDAYLPEDVITASDGTTIEITNTDAEGRLILADALIYAKKYNPDAVIDIATLTGACAMALAGVASGLFTQNDDLRNKLLNAAKTTDERLWDLPMYSEFGEVLKSNVADIKNSNKGGGIGSATMFLKRFAKFDAWAHIDMAGLSEDAHNRSYNKKGYASGYGVRLFVDLVKQYID